VPVFQQIPRPSAAGVEQMALDQDPKALRIEAERIAHAAVRNTERTLARCTAIVVRLRQVDLLEPDHRLVAAGFELAIDIVDIGDATRHAGGKVAPGKSEHGDDAAGHVFTAMIAGPFD